MKILIGIPTHDGRIDGGTAMAAYATASKHPVSVVRAQSSLIDQNCNSLWCAARMRYFARPASDVVAGNG